MAKLTGIFEYFSDLDQLQVENIQRWIKQPLTPINLQNHLANRLLYPQTVPGSKEDLEIDLAILREAIGNNIHFFLASKKGFSSSKQIVIPSQFLGRIPDLTQLAWVFIDGYRTSKAPQQYIISIVLKDGSKEQSIGSCVFVQFAGKNSQAVFELDQQKPQKLISGGLMVVPCNKNSCQMKFDIKNGSLLSLDKGVLEVNGGLLGVVLDGRTL